MQSQFSHIGIVGKYRDAGVRQTIARLHRHLASLAVTVTLETRTAEAITQIDAPTLHRQELAAACDLVVVVGGDGTLLHASHANAAHGTPLLGVNLGRLGFMVDVLPEEMPATLDKVLAGEFVRDERLLLTAHVQHVATGTTTGPYHALNDLVVRNKDFARVLEFSTTMDGSFITTHRADGIIAATPTGSTAYALSGGGPVMHPGLDALALVPICPHTLSDRPLIVDAGHRIEIVVDSNESNQALFTADGQVTQPLAPGDRVCIERAPHKLTLVHPAGYDYFNILRNKMHWGRNQSHPTR